MLAIERRVTRVIPWYRPLACFSAIRCSPLKGHRAEAQRRRSGSRRIEISIGKGRTQRRNSVLFPPGNHSARELISRGRVRLTSWLAIV